MLYLLESFSTASMKGTIDDTACTVAAMTPASLSDAVCCSSCSKALVHLQQQQQWEDEYRHMLSSDALGNICAAVMSGRVQTREEVQKAEALQSVPQWLIYYAAIICDGVGVISVCFTCNIELMDCFTVASTKMKLPGYTCCSFPFPCQMRWF